MLSGGTWGGGVKQDQELAAGTLGDGALGRAQECDQDQRYPSQAGAGPFYLLSQPLGLWAASRTPHSGPNISGGSSGEGTAASSWQPRSWPLGGEWPAQNGV